LKKLWSDKLIEILIANPSKLHFRQKVIHGDLKRLDYDLDDMHTLNLKIKEDIELALFAPLKQILADLHNFCRFAHLYKNL
jgi:hypothetical protein